MRDHYKIYHWSITVYTGLSLVFWRHNLSQPLLLASACFPRSIILFRYLQSLHTISAEKNSTIVFPLPMEILGAYVESTGVSLAIYQFIYLFIYLSTYRGKFIYLFMYPYFYLSILYISNLLSIHPSINITIHPFIHLEIYSSISLIFYLCKDSKLFSVND